MYRTDGLCILEELTTVVLLWLADKGPDGGGVHDLNFHPHAATVIGTESWPIKENQQD